MRQTISSDFKLGILGGGQLGKMLCQAASSWDITTCVLDPDSEASASGVSTHFVQGSFRDFDTVMKFAEGLDMITIEIEGVNIEAVEKLEQSGIPVLPQPSCLRIIRDKGLQKLFYLEHDLPTAPFKLFQNASEVRDAINQGQIRLPFVQKIRLSGYDGQGVLIARNEEDLKQLFDVPSLVEDFVEDALEIAVIVSRNANGETSCYPAVEMVFNPVANLVESLLSPARISHQIEKIASALAIKTAEDLGIIGLLAVEFFIDKQNHLLINEVAPRPHNSGHHTIESALTSQYEQHLRAIFGYHPGSTNLKMPAVMVNILGSEGFSGQVIYKGLNEVLMVEGVKLHIYGKKQTRPYRKMGHATILAKTPEEALEKADFVLKTLKVEA
ncbi:MAG: 5-(carboxyamino)imidazole ribonucleotide synthase [Bacteroidetes bacterium]|nr:MAG: 5-(carboxyamino)imidazole ribonucleotide synthase [Bacteroidota bacterium]